MGEVIVITSGKGGVGKTTTTANLGSSLALEGKKVVLVDTDIGLRNLDVVMGLENRIVYDIVDVVEEKCKLRQALIKDKRFKELYLLPAAQTRDKSAVNEEQMKKITDKLKEEFDYILIDCPAGIEQEPDGSACYCASERITHKSGTVHQCIRRMTTHRISHRIGGAHGA